MKITILGAGSIGGAMAKGLISKKVALPEDIILTARHETTLEPFRVMGCCTTLDNASAASAADIIVIAVKPWDVMPLVEQLKDSISRKTVVCMAAGMAGSSLSDILPKLIYAIPNTAMEVGESMTFITPATEDKEAVMTVRSLFDRLGMTMLVPADKLQSGTSLASCGIAYAMRYARAATEGGVELGFKAADALRIVEQTVIGAMKLLQAHGSHPEAEIDKVTTPGGMTIKGLNAMEREGFTNAVIEGLKAAK